MFTTTTTPAQQQQPAYELPASARLAQSLPSGTWRMLTLRGMSKKLPKGLDMWWDGLVGRVQALAPRRTLYLRRAERIMAMEKRYADMSDARLRHRAQLLRQAFRRGRDQASHRNHAFALIGEVVHRELGLRLHMVQVAAGLAMESGCIGELATGEGKTLSATLPAVLAGWRGRGCHVITVNDYLARRDAGEMGGIYRFCGLRVAYVDGEMPGPDRQMAYHADVTYCTNKEVAADYLRDRLMLGSLRGLSSAILGRMAGESQRGLDRLTLRGLECAIVDEADSVLIDEAVTPLIISGDSPNTEQVQAFQQAAELAPDLKPNVHYQVDQRFHEVTLTNAGRLRLAELAERLGGLWAGVRRREELMRQALVARDVYQRDKQYVVQDDKIVIVDEFTGRLMPDRTWRDGLHQAVEAKEKLTVNPMKGTLARISFQRFFRMYRKLAGMTGTAMENRQEFWVIYHLPTVPIPTHKPVIRTHAPAFLYATAEARWRAVAAEIQHVHAQGRPVLVGTRSVGASELLSKLLGAAGLDNQVLNAVRHAEEAQIVAGAGQPGRITVATNMAGRGTDIKLGRGVRELGGLHVIATERNEAGRIDRQLFGRTGRQGDPGSAVAYAGLDDELFARYAPRWLRLMLAARVKGAGTARDSLTRLLVNRVQRRAEKRAFQQRKGVLRSDDWLDEYLGFAGKEM